MRPLRYSRYVRIQERGHSSGGRLTIPRTPAESLALYLRLRKLKQDFLRRQATETEVTP